MVAALNVNGRPIVIGRLPRLLERLEVMLIGFMVFSNLPIYEPLSRVPAAAILIPAATPVEITNGHLS